MLGRSGVCRTEKTRWCNGVFRSTDIVGIAARSYDASPKLNLVSLVGPSESTCHFESDVGYTESIHHYINDPGRYHNPLATLLHILQSAQIEATACVTNQSISGPLCTLKRRDDLRKQTVFVYRIITSLPRKAYFD